MTCRFVGYVDFPIKNIRIPDRLRTVSRAHVEMMAESIKQIGGVMNPVTLGAECDDLLKAFLIAGEHRIESALLAGLEKIPAMLWENVTEDDALLMEIDENVATNKLSALDRANFLLARKELYERLHPETKKGAKNQYTVGLLNDTMSFSRDTEEKTGLKKKTIERAISIAKGIPSDLKKQLANSALANNGSELEKLAKHGPDIQKKIVELVLAEEAPAKNVKTAAAMVLGHTKNQEDKSEIRFKKFEDNWNRLTPSEQNRFLQKLCDQGQVILPAQKAAE